MKQLLAVVVSFVLLGSATAGDVKFEAVLKHPDGGPKKAGETVIRTQKEWKAFIENCQSKDIRSFLEGVKVDFGSEILVGIAMGPSNTLLGKGEMKEAGVRKVTGGEKVLVEYTEIFTDVKTEEVRYQVHVIRMPKAKEVTVKKTQRSIGG